MTGPSISADPGRLAVIGSAGRGLDGNSITPELYVAMYRETLRLMREWGIRDLVSGGAAYADHLAVLAYLNDEADSLLLHFPAPFASEPVARFIAPNGGSCASTANNYHDLMLRRLGIPGHAQLARAIRKGAQVTMTDNNFFARNTLVANDADAVLAFTFGQPGKTSEIDMTEIYRKGVVGHASSIDAGLKDGGTADTWRKSSRAEIKAHVDLSTMKRHLVGGLLPKVTGSEIDGLRRATFIPIAAVPTAAETQYSPASVTAGPT